MEFNSLLIHGGVDGDETTGAVNVPIYQTSTYKQIEIGRHKGYEYSRTGNPTRAALEKLIAELEEGYAGFAFASGLAALTTVLLLFKSGDKIIVSSNIYGGSFRLLDKVFKNFNLDYISIDTRDEKAIREAIDDDVKGILIETPTNPLMTVTDIQRVSTIAKENNILTIVDNTFLTPYLQQPIKLGADIVVHSATKYLGGHSDLIAGLVVVNNKELAERVGFLQNAAGAILNPFDAFLLIRGIKTLSVRLDRHIENALYVANYLKTCKAVEKIYYPGFPEDPGYFVQQKQAKGPGAIISFVLKKEYDVNEFLKGLKLITLGESLGGVESLITHPETMSHGSVPKEIREELGITHNMVRLSVGIEAKEDLARDIENSLKRIGYNEGL
jgi:cystathionine beta-lyase/cystathionine gamma-synthase